MKKILIVDDEKPISDIIKFNMTKEGYEVVTAFNGREAIELFEAEKPDIIILDLMLPEIDGLEVAKTIRKTSSVPIIMLSAKDSEFDKVIGLELGADDYVTKPFSPREIIARIKAIERRSQSQPQAPLPGNANQITVGQITIDPENYKASKAGHRLQLTPKEFELLVYFAQRVGKTLSRDALLNGVWGFDYPAETRMVDIQVSHLRDKIETDPKHPDYLKTVRGFGYQMEAPHE